MVERWSGRGFLTEPFMLLCQVDKARHQGRGYCKAYCQLPVPARHTARAIARVRSQLQLSLFLLQFILDHSGQEGNGLRSVTWRGGAGGGGRNKKGLAEAKPLNLVVATPGLEPGTPAL